MDDRLAAIILAFLAGPACASPPLLDSLNALTEGPKYDSSLGWILDQHHIGAWEILSDNKVAVLSSRATDVQYCYFLFDSSGRVSASMPGIGSAVGYIGGMASETVINKDGTVFMYINHALGNPITTQLEYWIFDYRKDRIESGEFPPPYLGLVSAGNYVDGIGNVLLTASMRREEPPYRIVVHKKPGKKPEAFQFDLDRTFGGRGFGMTFHELGDNKIILTNNNVIDNQFVLSWMVFDLKKGKPVFSDRCIYADLNAPGLPQHDLSETDQFCEFDGRLYYLTPAMDRFQWKRVCKYYDSLIVEFDQEGRLVPNENRSVTSIVNSELESIPENFLLILSRSNRKQHFWMVSFDELPTVIVDDGY